MATEVDVGLNHENGLTERESNTEENGETNYFQTVSTTKTTIKITEQQTASSGEEGEVVEGGESENSNTVSSDPIVVTSETLVITKQVEDGGSEQIVFEGVGEDAEPMSGGDPSHTKTVVMTTTVTTREVDSSSKDDDDEKANDEESEQMKTTVSVVETVTTTATTTVETNLEKDSDAETTTTPSETPHDLNHISSPDDKQVNYDNDNSEQPQELPRSDEAQQDESENINKSSEAQDEGKNINKGSSEGQDEGENVDNDLEEDPAMLLSSEEAQLLEKLKYQPFEITEELQSLTSEQREKINLYQRRESLARANSFKRAQQQSPTCGSNFATSTATRLSAGEGGNEMLPGFDGTKKRPSTSSTSVIPEATIAPTQTAQQREQKNFETVTTTAATSTVKGVNVVGGDEDEDIGSSNLYQQMRLLAPKPYIHHTDTNHSTNSDSTPASPEATGEKKSRMSSTFPISYKMSSEGDVRKGVSDAKLADRSQSIKEAQEGLDRSRQNVYEMRMKFLGLEVPTVYPYKYPITDLDNNERHTHGGQNGTAHDEVGDDEEDMVVVKSNRNNLQSSAPSILTSKIDKENTNKTNKHNSASVKQPPSASTKEPIEDNDCTPPSKRNPFYRLLCGSGSKTKDN